MAHTILKVLVLFINYDNIVSNENCTLHYSSVFNLNRYTNLWLTLIGNPRFLQDTSGKGLPVTVQSKTVLVPSLSFWFCGNCVKRGASGSMGDGILSSLVGALSALNASLTGDMIGDPEVEQCNQTLITSVRNIYIICLTEC